MITALQKKQGWYLVAIVLVALNLRPALAAIGPLLQGIQTDLLLSFSAASLLTTLPVLAMGLLSFVGFRLAAPLGLERTIGVALLLLAAATLLRFWSPSASLLIATALLAGIAIALIQTLMPAIIKARFAGKAPFMMGLYVTAIMAGAAIAAISTPLLADSLSWRHSLGHWGWLVLLALLLWLWAMRPSTEPACGQPAPPAFAWWRKARSWQLAVFFALGTSCYVSVLAWLAPYALELGYSARQAGLLLGFLTACEVVAGLLFPWWAAQRADRRPVIAVLCVLQLVGFSALALMPETALLLWVAFIGLGIGGIFPLAMIITMDHIDHPVQAGRLTAFVQGVGYIIAAFSPWLAGMLRDWLQSFTLAWLALAATSVLALWLGARFSVASYQQHYAPAEVGA
ncbi:cyanate transporter [Alkalimonas sp. MEB108]|uniref:Cyanate transporter n=1 Tax=Alkalimonas cellulosilytica TaxID=3058395 RepID=A0ABU7J6F2_9GAMM|nr:cyanate transporter [Alkalimonas sp. MEB108]MEE2002094.1 cyanate transporter [Alkalimonas sp. MEB108]